MNDIATAARETANHYVNRHANPGLHHSMRVWVESSARLLYTEVGGNSRMLCTRRDVAQRKIERAGFDLAKRLEIRKFMAQKVGA